MIGKIKIFSKAIMLNRTRTLSAVLLISIAVLFLSNNIFVAAQYLFDFLSEKHAFSFLTGSTKVLSLAVLYSFCIFLSVMLASPLKLSREIWFYETAKKNYSKLRKMFFSYKLHWFFKSTSLVLSLLLVKFLWAFFYFFPFTALVAYLVYSLQIGISKTMLLLVGTSILVSFFSGLFFCFVTFQRYSLSFILFYENDATSPFEAMKLSAQLMDEKCFSLARLKLSFLGWILSCMLVLPVFYVYPYYKISVAYFLNNILIKGGTT